MPLDPVLLPLLAEPQSDDPPATTVAEARARHDRSQEQLRARFYREPPAPAEVRELAVPVEGASIAARAFRPHGEGPFPVHVYLHGGGFWLGSVDGSDIACRELCAASGALVVSVGYRLAPEHPFPTPAEDCYAALCWIAEHAGELGGDPGLLSVGGESAGGNLAAVVSLMARDREGPRLVAQVLSIPVTDLTMSQPSVSQLGKGYGLTWEGMVEYRNHYLPEAGLAADPYVSPLFAPNLVGLPTAIVSTMEFDPLRDEGEAYARRLVEAGVPTVQRRSLGQIHGSAMFTAVSAFARDYYIFLGAQLQSSYRRAGFGGEPV
ncbi:MAG: alpha/beta hydrolase [Acidimicrobiaceae bacterium]|nr:alpha/beta hydrolase [Acidimicrobiaceae bacterium]